MPFEHKPKKARKQEGKQVKRLSAAMSSSSATDKNTAPTHAVIEAAMTRSDAQAKTMLVEALSSKAEHQTSAEVFQSIHAYLVHEGHHPQKGRYGLALQSKDNKIITPQMLSKHKSKVNHRRLVKTKAEKVVEIYMTTRQEKSKIVGTEAMRLNKKQRAQPQLNSNIQGTHNVPHHPPSQIKAGVRRALNKTKTDPRKREVISQSTTHISVAGHKTAPVAKGKRTKPQCTSTGDASKKRKSPHKNNDS